MLSGDFIGKAKVNRPLAGLIIILVYLHSLPCVAKMYTVLISPLTVIDDYFYIYINELTPNEHNR